MDVNKMRNRSVGFVAESVYAAYAETRAFVQALEPEHFFEEWMADNVSWCSEAFSDKVFGVFMQYLQLTAGDRK